MQMSKAVVPVILLSMSECLPSHVRLDGFLVLAQRIAAVDSLHPAQLQSHTRFVSLRR